MNEKVMNVFNKNNEQLDKELARRGLPYQTHSFTAKHGKSMISRERAIAEIIYKDAFDCGRIEASQTCPEGCKGSPEVKNYFLRDDEEKSCWNITLTNEQARLIEWLLMENILCPDYVSFVPASRVINVGRIE